MSNLFALRFFKLMLTMKRLFVFQLIFMMSMDLLYGQSLPMGNTGGSRIFIKPGAYAFVTELPPAPKQTVGDYYLENEWLLGDILLTDSLKLEALYFRYNLKDDVFEIRTESDVKVLPGRRVLGFDWRQNQNLFDGEYRRADSYTMNGTHLNGFLKLIQGGQYSLATNYEFRIIPGNYNTALNVGEKNDRIVKEEVFYILYRNNLLRVDSNRKKFTEELGKFTGRDLGDYIKSKKVSPKEVEDLLLITTALNKES